MSSRDIGELTAVISNTKRDFHEWCKVRGIKLNKDRRYVDSHGDEYKCILKKDDARGLKFDDCEDISYHVWEHYKRIEQAKEEVKRRMI